MSKKGIRRFKKKDEPLIGIVGGKGRMGSWFKNFFEKQGLKVIISDIDTKLSNQELAKHSDVVIVSVPIKQTLKVIQEIAPYVRKDALLADITSIKTEPVKAMRKAKSGVLGMHPLFGPLVPNLENQNIVFCEVKKNKWTTFLRKLFIKNKAKIIEISPEDHDRQMAFLQSLTHFSNISFSHFLYTQKFKPLPSFLTPTFRLQSLVFGRILAQNPELYADIELKNPYFKQLSKEYIKEILSFQKTIEKEDYQEFKKRFKEASSYLSNFVKIAEEKTTEILKTIEKQPVKIGSLKRIKIKKAKIGFLGPKYTFSWTAAKKISNSNSSLIPFFTIKEVFMRVNNLEVDLAVVPIQNAISGIVSETMYQFIDYPLFSLGSFKIPIHYCLLSKEKSLKDIKIVKSHPQALSQCRIWLGEHLPKALKIPTSSTVSALSEKPTPPETGFIVPLEAASEFKLTILARNIEDKKENFTRFLVIGRELDKSLLRKINLYARNTLLLLSVYDRVGILRDILNIFANRGINLSALHSISSIFHPWDYLFFLEVEKSYFSPGIRDILRDLNQYCPFVRVLGVA